MTAVGMDQIIGQSFGNESRKTGQTGSLEKGAAFIPTSILPADGRDQVSLSNAVPRPLPAQTLESAALLRLEITCFRVFFALFSQLFLCHSSRLW